MVSHIFPRKAPLRTRQLSSALALALSTFLYLEPGTAHAAIVIDNFKTVSGVDTNVSNTGGAPTVNVEAPLPGTLGAQRITSVQNLTGSETVKATIDPTPGLLRFQSGGATATQMMLQYNNPGNGLPANVQPFMGLSIPFTFVDDTALGTINIKVELTDGVGTATGTAQVTTDGAQTLLIPPSAFGGTLGGVNLGAITGIKFTFDGGENNDYTFGPITILTPEPLAILGGAVVLMMGLVGWRSFGSRLRSAQ